MEKLINVRRVISAAILDQNLLRTLHEQIHVILPVLSGHFVEVLYRHRLRRACHKHGGRQEYTHQNFVKPIHISPPAFPGALMHLRVAVFSIGSVPSECMNYLIEKES
jgi:hypothetical protein